MTTLGHQRKARRLFVPPIPADVGMREMLSADGFEVLDVDDLAEDPCGNRLADRGVVGGVPEDCQKKGGKGNQVSGVGRLRTYVKGEKVSGFENAGLTVPATEDDPVFLDRLDDPHTLLDRRSDRLLTQDIIPLLSKHFDRLGMPSIHDGDDDGISDFSTRS